MNKHVQIRNVSPTLHRKLKAQARKQGLTLSAHLIREMEWTAARPTLREMAERVRKLPPIKLDPPSEVLIREDRDSR
jgi:hypothetical protein